MRVVLDGTPLLGPRTGVGRYTAALLAGLGELARVDQLDLDVAATAFTWRGSAGLAAALPPGVRPAARRVPARLLQDAWMRSEHPPTEWLTGAADIIHGTNFVLGPLAAADGVLTVHDLSYLRTPDTVSEASARYTTLVPRGLRRAAAVLTPSQAVADEVIAAYRLDPELVTPTPLGVDPAWFTAAAPARSWLAAHGLPDRYLLFVGSAEPRKNLPALLEALRRLRATERDTPPLALVGPPGWGPALDTAGLPPEAVVTLGYLDDAELRSVVAGAAVLCFPSRYEGFGLPPLEALAAGTRVVAADIPAVREVVGGAAGVRLVAGGRADAFADDLAGALSAALSAPANGTETARGRDHARAFTWRRTAELTAAVYQRVAR
ncbi:glycosyl transferase family 1 [Frankia sp. R43]|uniref:glycosyltransferase family 4 protein n=1 Tax=Frankia sp. R43 TaxID=269536 RepID=UPI0006CA113D|nr:glycosyltransferase family 1 protein [Frankia sp. R43]KPM51403.1 glycosyl transferase family 1 [Frankia sp. R43]